MLRAFAAIVRERRRQDAKHGYHDMPDGTGDATSQLYASIARQRCDERTEAGVVTWADVLLEEVLEAIAESDATALRSELVQVAAVAVKWIEFIDARDWDQNETESSSVTKGK